MVGSKDTHRRLRANRRRRLEAMGVPAEEIERQIETIRREQLAARRAARTHLYAENPDVGPPESRLADGSHPTSSQRRKVIARDGYFCRYCGGPVRIGDMRSIPRSECLTIDHVTPRSRGGSNWATNRVVACCRCNEAKGARTAEEWGRPLLPPRGPAAEQAVA